MIKNFKLGICSECKKECDILEVVPPEKLIVNKSKNLCTYHNKIRLKPSKAKPPKVRQAYLKKFVRKATGEGELFKEIWDALEPEERVSFVTGYILPTPNEMRAYYFSHLLSKGAYPEFRLLKENIVLMTLEEHQLWENYRHKIMSTPKLYKQWIHVFDRADHVRLGAKNKQRQFESQKL